MITFKELRKKLELYEARKNPELNQKSSMFDVLLKYKNDPNIFISFSNDKIGIKPMASYETPIGIYAYPIKQAFKFYNITNINNFGNIPYGLSYKNIFILKRKSNVKELNLSTLDENEYNQLCEKLLNVVDKNNNFNNGNSEGAYNVLYRKCMQYGLLSKFPLFGEPIDTNAFTFSKLKKDSIEYNVIIKELKKLELTYHSDFDVVDMLKTTIQTLKSSKIKYGEKFYFLTLTTVKFFFEPHKMFTTSKVDFKFIKTKDMNNVIKYEKVSYAFKTFDHIKRWRTLFSNLGIDIVTDNGDKIIHENEPCQSFFIDKSKFEIVDIISNSLYRYK